MDASKSLRGLSRGVRPACGRFRRCLWGLVCSRSFVDRTFLSLFVAMIGLSGHPPLIFLGRGEAVNGAEGGTGSGAGCGVVAVSGRPVELRQAVGRGRRGSS